MCFGLGLDLKPEILTHKSIKSGFQIRLYVWILSMAPTLGFGFQTKPSRSLMYGK